MPTTASLTKQLAEKFGPDNVCVRTQHHIQVVCGHRPGVNAEGQSVELPNFHDIWINSGGQLKFKPYGKNGKARNSPNPTHLINTLSQYVHEHSDLAQAREALDLAKLIRQAQTHTKDDIDRAWYVDAGWKDGIATIGAVFVQRTEHGVDVEAHSWTLPMPNSAEAEHEAVKRAATRIADVPIFSDNKAVVESAKADGLNISWIPREQNRVADRIGNRRNAG